MAISHACLLMDWPVPAPLPTPWQLSSRSVHNGRLQIYAPHTAHSTQGHAHSHTLSHTRCVAPPQGVPAPAPAAAAPSAAPKGPQAAQGQAQVKLFVYGTEEAATVEAIQGAGWSGRVVVTRDVSQADAVISAKVNKAGKHVKLLQVGGRGVRFPCFLCMCVCVCERECV